MFKGPITTLISTFCAASDSLAEITEKVYFDIEIAGASQVRIVFAFTVIRSQRLLLISEISLENPNYGLLIKGTTKRAGVNPQY